MMLINPDEVVTGALVNAIAVVGRQISKVAAGMRKTDENLAMARWFETFRLTRTLPDLHGLSQVSWDRLAEALGSDEIQAALQELLAARLTAAPETDASRARDAVQVALSFAGADAAAFAGALADYYDDQICALVARLEAEDPPVLAQIRSEAFSSRMISILYAIERKTAPQVGKYAVSVSGSQGVQAGDHNTQVNNYFISERVGPQATAGPTASSQAGRLLAEITDPFALEVHQSVQAADPQPGLSALPTYVPRRHDRELAQVVRAAIEGTSGIAVLVGGSSTGKTRACWEALTLLRNRPDPWRLWHPIFPDRADAFLAQLDRVSPRTVVWLNEAQHYLLTSDPAKGEQVAAGLRDLLRDSQRAPVLVLGTIWPQYWQSLSASPSPGEPDSRSDARHLLVGNSLDVPDKFSGSALTALADAAAKDSRLAEASAGAENGQVAQYLAGVPVLLERYQMAPPTAKAVIHAAMDALRLGYGSVLPYDFLEVAATGYLSDLEWEQAGESWVEGALDYSAAPCRGIRGPLTRIRPRPALSGRSVTDARVQESTKLTTGLLARPSYQLADFLEQVGRRARAREIPPSTFWDAAISSANPSALTALGLKARYLRLYRIAAKLLKRAIPDDFNAAGHLIRMLQDNNPETVRDATNWISENVCVTDAAKTFNLLCNLREADDHEAFTILASRAALEVDLRLSGSAQLLRILAILWDTGKDEAAHILARRIIEESSLESPFGVDWLLDRLQRAGDYLLAAELTHRVAATFPLDNLFTVAGLLAVLRATGADDDVTMLLERDPARTVPLDDPSGVAQLLRELKASGAHKAISTLVARIVETIPVNNTSVIPWLLENLRYAGLLEQNSPSLTYDPSVTMFSRQPFGIANLLRELREADAHDAVSKICAHIVRTTPLDNPGLVALRLGDLRETGLDAAAVALAKRAADITSLEDLRQVGFLLTQLAQAGTREAVATLAERAARAAPLDNLGELALFLERLDAAGAYKAATALAERAARTAPINDPYTAAGLLGVLRGAGAFETAATLVARIVEAILSDSSILSRGEVNIPRPRDQLNFNRTETIPPSRDYRTPFGVANLLLELGHVGAYSEITVITDHIAQTTPLDNPRHVALRLGDLREAGAEAAVAKLAERASCITLPDDLPGIGFLLTQLAQAGANEVVATLAGRIAQTVPLPDPDKAVELLEKMRMAGADEAANALEARVKQNILSYELPDCVDEQAIKNYPYGCEPDGLPSTRWSWADLA